jgi:hypothetical protein
MMLMMPFNLSFFCLVFFDYFGLNEPDPLNRAYTPEMPKTRVVLKNGLYPKNPLYPKKPKSQNRPKTGTP